MIKTVGSVCSGIEAASVAWNELGYKFEWFSEIAQFPCQLLQAKYPHIKNLGDMNLIPDLIREQKISAPDIICGGTPCQAFSLAGNKNGLNDNRGNLTLRFVDIIDANDSVREKTNQPKTIVFWENVEGVLSDKTNAFGCFVSSLAGLTDVVSTKWPSAGLIRGPKRNVAWRVLDAKYFGIPQQRKRLYLLAGDKNFNPENILFELHTHIITNYPKSPLKFQKGGHEFEIFREYTDCLYSAYGTKWNGNAAANNGSLFVVQDGKIRRLSPLECERLMGLPDNYTQLPTAKRTNRYQAIGNSWAIPVVKWIGGKILNPDTNFNIEKQNPWCSIFDTQLIANGEFYDFGIEIVNIKENQQINCSTIPETVIIGSMENIISPDVTNDIYISPVGCYGIIRRTKERNISLNNRLEKILLKISSEMPLDEIEKKSKKQIRGKHSHT